MNLTRKLRKYLKVLRKRGKIDAEKYRQFRKKVKSKEFKSLAYLIDALNSKPKMDYHPSHKPLEDLY